MSTVGILGGGQLGLMLAQAAHGLGQRVAVYAPPGDNIAFREADIAIEGAYDDHSKLGQFALAVNDGRVLLEFENVPVATLQYLRALGVQVCPNEKALAVAQDRVQEKKLARELDIPTGPHCCFKTNEVPAKASVKHLFPGILKTARFGYDGLGQVPVASYGELCDAAGKLKEQWVVLEQRVPFRFEMSVILARNAKGEGIFFPSTTNVHKGGILRETLYCKDGIPWSVELSANRYTRRIANHLGLVGLIAVEFFVVGGGVLFNEMAPRPHNTGHWTIEGCKTSQFMAYIQAAMGIPFTPIEPRSGMKMINLIGPEIEKAATYRKSGAVVHDYGKKEVRPGRKMGHVTFEEKSK